MITLEDIVSIAVSRNPLVFGLFSRMRMVEQIGSGIGRIRSLMNEHRLPAPQFSYEGMFTVVLNRPFDFEKWVNKWVDKLTDNRVAIIKAIYNNKVTKKELEDIVGISATALDNNLAYLKELGIIDRIGTKGGTWIMHLTTPKVGE